MRTGRYILVIIILTSIIKVSGQNRFYILEGNIVNSETGLFVNDAQVRIPSVDKEITAGSNGIFRMAAPAGENVSIIINHPDYEMKLAVLNLKSDTSITFQIKPLLRSVLIGEIEKTADRFDKVEELQTGLEKLPAGALKKLPALGGEKDVLKAFTYFPGIQSGTEGTTEMIVRGGSSDQNLYLLDNNILYKSSHLLGMLSSFQALSAEEIEFYKGGFPSKYGGRLSSVVDVKTRAPNFKDFSLEGEIGIISAKLLSEIPVVKEKSSLMIAVRTTYLDKIAKLFVDTEDYESYNFYDTQIKWSTKIKDNNLLTINGFYDRDNYYIFNKTGKQKDIYSRDEQIWSNRFLSANYKATLKNNGTANFFIGYSGYDMRLNSLYESPDSIRNYNNQFKTSIKDFTINNYTSFSSSKWDFNFGGSLTLHQFTPALVNNKSYDFKLYNNNLPEKNTFEFSIFGELMQDITDNLTGRIGFRNTNYKTDNKIYSSVEPRILLKYKTTEQTSLKISYSRMTQFLHLLTNPGLGLPVDLWMSSDENVRPEISNQISLGYAQNFDLGNHKLALNTEVYYKKLKNIVSYRDGFSSHNFTTPYFFKNNLNWQSAIIQGTGSSKGLELMIEKYSGDFSGWISYSLASVIHEFKELNNGKPFPSNYDHRHNLSIVGNYRINPRHDFTFSWVYGSGHPVTLPLYIYFPGSFHFSNGTVNFHNKSHLSLYAQSERNKYRMMPFHRLNVAIQRKFETKNFTGNFELSVYNLYNRKNPFYYYVDNVPYYEIKENDSTRNKSETSTKICLCISVYSVCFCNI